MLRNNYGADVGRKAGGSSNDPYIGARIRWLREANKLSLTKLAEESGLTKGYLSKVENGLAGASFATVEQLAAALGVTASSIWDFRRPPDDAVPPKLRRRV